MIKTIVGAGSDSIEGKNFDLGGVMFTIKAQHTTVNTTIVAGDFDFSKARVKASLNRDGQEIVLFTDVLSVLNFETNFENTAFELPIVQSVAKGASTKEIAVINMSIELHSPINVRGEDKITVEVNFDSGTFGSNIDTANTTTRVQLLDIEGDEIGIPVIESKTITAGQQSFNISGDDVNSLTLINTDKTSTLLSDKVVESVVITTKELRNNLTYEQLLGLRQMDFETNTSASARKQSFRVLGKGDHDGCNVEIALNGTNVTSAKNWVITRRTIMNRKSVALGVTRAAERSEAKAVRVGVGNPARLQALNQRKKALRSSGMRR
jgi:hypothetical protein